MNLMDRDNLKIKFPRIASEWDYEKNEKLPQDFKPQSNKKAWFVCKEKHSFETVIAKRTNRGDGCPYCSGRKVGYGNDFESNYPKLASEWDYKKNSFKPSEVAKSSHKDAWFICSKNSSHSYKSRIANRVFLKSGCSYCASKLISKDVSFAGRYPKIAKEWDYEKNSKKPDEIFPGTREHFWWLCKEGHSYKSSVSNRASLGRGCPYCGNHIAGYGNDLKTKYPQIADEWDYKKNKTKPEEHTRRSGKKVWWICTIGHSYDATIDKRVSDRGCPYCKLTPRSKEEIYLLFELKYFFDIDPEDTKIKLSKVESVDIKINEINTIVEYDGAYWHQDRALKDSSKTKELEKLGWIVVRVREKPLKLNNKKFDISTKPKEYKETANKTLRKLKSLGNDIKELNKYLEIKTLINKKEADQYINKLLLKKKKNSVS